MTETLRKALLKKVSGDSFYDRYMGLWIKKFEPVLLRFESLLQQEDFPQENQTEYKEKLDVTTINIIRGYINEERENFLSKENDRS